MENNATPIEVLFQRAEDYGKTTFMLLRLGAINKSANLASFIATKAIVFLAVALFLITFNVGLSLWIGELLGKSYYGFFIVSILYIAVTAVLHIFRIRWIQKPVRNAVIVEMLKK